MVQLAQIDPTAGAPAAILVLCIIFVGPISLILHFVLRQFRFVVTMCTIGFTFLLLAVWLYFELFRRGQSASTGSDVWDFAKLILFGALVSLLVSSAAGVPLLVARHSEEKRKRRPAARPS